MERIEILKKVEDVLCVIPTESRNNVVFSFSVPVLQKYGDTFFTVDERMDGKIKEVEERLRAAGFERTNGQMLGDTWQDHHQPPTLGSFLEFRGHGMEVDVFLYSNPNLKSGVCSFRG